MGAEYAGGVEAVDAIYAEVRGPLGPPPDPQCYGAVVDAFVAYGDVSRALAAISAAEREPNVHVSSRTYLGVMRAYAAAGDVRGVATLAARLEKVLAGRAVSGRRGGASKTSEAFARVVSSSASAAAALGGDMRETFCLEPTVQAEVVMCEAEAKAAAGDAAGARAALERLKRLDYGASSKVLRERSTELLVSLFVKDVVGEPSRLNKASRGSRSGSESRADILSAAGDAFADGDEDLIASAEAGDDAGGSAWGVTQALDLIDSAWGFASLDEDDAFLPSLDEDDIPVPSTRGFGGFLAGAVRRSEWLDISEGPYPGGGDWTSPDYATAPTLRSAEAADALELWTGAISRLLAGDAEPLVFKGGVDPEQRLCDARSLGSTLDESSDDDCFVEWAADGSFSGWNSASNSEAPCSRLPNAFVVKCDALAGPAAASVGRDVVAVVVDANLKPIGTLMGSSSSAEIADFALVKDVMGPKPTIVRGDAATVGDVAVVCAAAALDEPVAIVDANGTLRRVLRREDLLLPARSRVPRPRGRGTFEGGGANGKFTAANDPR
jgi:hypothetical protein